MCQEDQAIENSRRTKRKRALVNAGRTMLFVFGCAYFVLLIKVIAIGYLTWIGIVAGVVYFAPGVISPIAGLAGKRRTEAALTNVSIGMTLLLALVLAVIPVLPKRNTDGWRPYSFDAEIAALEAQRAVGDEDNAAIRYEAALAAVNVNDRPDLGAEAASPSKALSQQPWRTEHHPQVAAWLDSHATVLDELLQIGQMEECRWPLYAGSGTEQPVPYKELRYGIQLLTLAGNRDLGEGRLEESLKKGFCLLRIADHLRQQTDLVDIRASFACEVSALQMIRYSIASNELSSETMDRVAQHLPNVASTWRREVKRLLEFDEYRFANYLASIYEINEQGKIRFAASFPDLLEAEPGDRDRARVKRLLPLYYHLNMPLDPQGVWAMARCESNQMRRILESDALLRTDRNELDPFGSLFGLCVRTMSNWPRFTAQALCFDVFMYTSLPVHCTACLTQRRGTWLVLGLRRYRDEHGSWPQSLNQVSEYAPAEAFLDPTSGDRFVYVLDSDSFKLYGTGINRIDEDGRSRYKHEDDIAIWPPYVRPPEPETKKSTELMKKQLKEIYGEDARKPKPEDANSV